ncbi:MAG: DUF3108 domain-containing protein [candidate division Zixibacteria bacterium CG_4_9_14_3_um_filter_46_8]|nr:MAG: DUF3108 domain-containing protein [candidate division Zixibacteria bacterium CG_4_9_14_3_um_filter_46_8]
MRKVDQMRINIGRISEFLCGLCAGLAIIIGFATNLRSDDGAATPEDDDLFPQDSVATYIDSSGINLDSLSALYNAPEWWRRSLQNEAWGAGERFEFIIRYGPIKAGSAVMEVKNTVDCAGHNAYHVTSTAQSSGFFSMFFKVDDRVETFIDTEGIFPHRFEKHLNEGKFKADKVTNFDQKNHLAITGKDTIRTYPFVQDILSAFYYARTLALEVGKPVLIDNHTDRKNYPLEIKVHRRERVSTRAGTFNCLLLEPVLRTSAIFENKGRLLVWITDDNFKMPVMMKSKVLIGSITTELVWYRLAKS